MPNIADMLVRIDASTERMERKLKKADRTINRFQKTTNRKLSKIDRGFEKIGATIKSRLLPVLGIGVLGAAVHRSISDLSNLKDQADKLGLSTTQLQEFRFAASEVGVGITAADVAMQRFTRRVAEAQEGQGELKGILEQYNIALFDNQGKTRSSMDVLGDLANVIETTAGSGERLRIAFKSFDTEGVQLVNALKDGSKGLDDFSRRAHELGVVVDEDLVAKADEFDKAWNRAMLSNEVSFKSFAISIISQSADIFDEVSKLNSIISQNAALSLGLSAPRDNFSNVEFNQPLQLGGGIGLFQAQLSNPEYINDLEKSLLIEDNLPRPRSTPSKKIRSQIQDELRAEEDAIAVEKARREAILNTVTALEYRSAQIRRNARDQDLYNQLGAAGVDIKSIEGQKIQELVGNYHDYSDAQRDAEERAQALDDAARDLGLTFSSAFEDAIVGGAELSDVLQGLLQDIIRIAAREVVVAPLASAAKGFFGGIGDSIFGNSGGGKQGIVAGEWDDLFGGFDLGSIFGFAGGGNPPVGRVSVVGEQGPELFVPKTSGTIIPNHALGGGSSFNQIINIDARGADEGFFKRWPLMEQQIIEKTTAAVAAETSRGGSYSKLMGKR